mmetsp:Transcript_37216/g.92539  ORF Transcript_37216/g.92539 Transcript_37216/m.92539 type:complete len:260 (+) Transcript_37216:1226-2005(+)
MHCRSSVATATARLGGAITSLAPVTISTGTVASAAKVAEMSLCVSPSRVRAASSSARSQPWMHSGRLYSSSTPRVSLERSCHARRFATSPISERSRGRSMLIPRLVLSRRRTGAGTAASSDALALSNTKPAVRTRTPSRTPGLFGMPATAACMATRHPSACPANTARVMPSAAHSSSTSRACTVTEYGLALSGKEPRSGRPLSPNPGRSRATTRMPCAAASAGPTRRHANTPAPKPWMRTSAESLAYPVVPTEPPPTSL